MQICLCHKSTAVYGLTFLFVTSKHSSVPPLSLLLDSSAWPFTTGTNFFSCYISTNAVCLNNFNECSSTHNFFKCLSETYHDRTLLIMWLLALHRPFRTVVGNIKMKFFPSRHRPTAAGTNPVGDTTFIPGSGQSSCVLSLILTSEQRGHSQTSAHLWHYPLYTSVWLLRTLQLLSAH